MSTSPRSAYGFTDDPDMNEQFHQPSDTISTSNQIPPTIPLTPRELAMQAELETLRRQVSSNSREPKVTDPEMYTGKRDKTRQFLIGLRRVFLTQPSRFTTEGAKVLYSLGRLSDAALSWSIPLQENNNPVLHSFETFEQALIDAFGIVDKKQDAIRRIRALKQGSRPASQYAASFSQLQFDTGYNDGALYDQFYEGLNENIKDVLSQQLLEPTSLSELVKLSIRIDNRLFERKQERQNNHNSNSKSNINSRTHNQVSNSWGSTSYARTAHSQNSGSYSSGPTPMQLDNVVHRGPLSKEERDRRIREGCCKYCGEKGHFVETCPKKKSINAVKSISFSDKKGKGKSNSVFRDNQDPPPNV
jgi:hypothetical protein